MRIFRYATRGALVLLAAAALPLAAQSYPVKPVKIIMPFPPGGTNDLVARAVAIASPARSSSRWSSTIAPAPVD